MNPPTPDRVFSPYFSEIPYPAPAPEPLYSALSRNFAALGFEVLMLAATLAPFALLAIFW